MGKPSAEEREKEAKKSVNENKDQAREIQKKLDALPEGYLAYASLVGKALSKKVGEHDYKVEFFDRAKQGHTSLGNWAKWTGPRSGVFENGQHCWDGPARKL